MPRVAMDYSKTVIYHFVCQDKTITCSYVGSTTNFVKRKYNHKSSYNNERAKNHMNKLYQTIRDNGGWANWEMVPLEEFSCENGIQQTMREQSWINKLKPELNHNPAIQPNTKQQTAQYREIHKEEIRSKNRERLKKDDVKEYHKNYRENHREKAKEYAKQYRAKRKSIPEQTHSETSPHHKHLNQT